MCAMQTRQHETHGTEARRPEHVRGGRDGSSKLLALTLIGADWVLLLLLGVDLRGITTMLKSVVRLLPGRALSRAAWKSR